jgi:putative oxidoreductase
MALSCDDLPRRVTKVLRPGKCHRMSALRELARPLLASIFVIQGWQSFESPEYVAPIAEPIVRPLRDRIPGVPAETEDAVRINGAIQAAAGTMLGLGVLPRLAALAIAGTLVPTTLAGHRYWDAKDPRERATQRIQFLKNLTMLGGLLLAVADTGGSPSLSWRRRHARKVVNSYMSGLSHLMNGTAGEFAHAARHAAAAGAR